MLQHSLRISEQKVADLTAQAGGSGSHGRQPGRRSPSPWTPVAQSLGYQEEGALTPRSDLGGTIMEEDGLDVENGGELEPRDRPPR